MYKCKTKTYEGNLPYIFVSYAHKDSDIVLPLLDQLSARGFRVWYDDGIEPGSEWPENIATHLACSSVVIAMISDNSIDSPNCRNELTFAFSRNKPFLGVVLERVTLPAGMEMQLSGYQCVQSHQIRNPKTGEIEGDLFIERVCSAEILRPCLKSKLKQESVSMPVTTSTSSPDLVPIPTPSVGENQKDSEPSREKEHKPKAFTVWSMVLSCLAIVALFYAFYWLNSDAQIASNSDVLQITPNSSFDRDAQFASFRDEKIDKDTIAKLSRLNSLTSLSFYSCSFEDASPTDLLTLDQLSLLIIKDCTGITYFDFSNAYALISLTVSASNLDNNGLKTLRASKLSELRIPGNSECFDLSVLPDCLTVLDVSNTGVTDISAVPSMPNLKELSIDSCKISNVEPVAFCKSLRIFSARNCGISSWQNRFASLRLETLLLDDNPLQDASCFDDLTRLKKLSLNNTEVSHADCIVKSANTLELLGLNHTKFDSDVLILDVASCNNIRFLQMAGICCNSLRFIQDMVHLVYLDAEGCGLVNINALAYKPKLKTVYLGNNNITDASALASLSADRIQLDLHNNPLSHLALPAAVDTLLLYGTRADALSALPLTSVSTLVFNFDERIFGEDYAVLCELDHVTYPYVLDAPADRVVDTEDFFGEYRTTLLSTKQFEDAYYQDRDLEQVADLKFE